MEVPAIALKQKDTKTILSTLPLGRKALGQRAHLDTYKKILSYVKIDSLFKFLSIKKPDTEPQKVRLFFEVTLGRRIADCILLVFGRSDKTCYIIELKTCMPKTYNMTSDVKLAQRTQGLNQLMDCASFLNSHCPVGNSTWKVYPHLLFKSQRSLKTIYTETAFIPPNHIHSNDDKLISFFFSREDDVMRKLLYSSLQRPPSTHIRPVLGTTSQQRTINQQKLLERNKKKCFKLQTGLSQNGPGKKKKKPSVCGTGQSMPSSSGTKHPLNQ
uniref:Nuclear protein UL24 n=4 Tax=Bovine herpesvirus 4 TaxID=10385 RepID=A0A0F6N4X5_BHV4|nr:hypothetical protein [Bovine gammaherpesvirus 4]QJC19193.1 hypothetical protein [Bovine gammaherpesvirus 4]